MFCEPRSRLLLSADHVGCVPVPVSATAASSPLDWTVSVPDSSPGVGGGVKVTWTVQNSFWARTVGTGLALQSPSWGSTPKAALSVETASIVTELASVFVIVTGWAVVVPSSTSCVNWRLVGSAVRGGGGRSLPHILGELGAGGLGREGRGGLRHRRGDEPRHEHAEAEQSPTPR